MNIIHSQDWEYLKTQPPFWTKYNGSIPFDDRDQAVLKIGDAVVLPKFFIKNNLPELLVDHVGNHIVKHNKIDEIHIGHSSTLTVISEPRPEQIEAFQIITKTFQETGNISGIIKAAPGWGKTFLGIKTASILKQKVLYIVPNDILEGQWVDSIIQFSNLNKEDIGIIQGSDIVSMITKGVFSKDVVVCKVQSLLSQVKTLDLHYLEELYSCFGLVFYDEAHVSGSAEGFSKTSYIFKTNNIIGLTATPYRAGLNEFLLLNAMGEMFYESDHQNLVPTISLHNAHVEFNQKEISRLMFSKVDYIRFLATYNMILAEKDEYFNYLADWVVFRYQQGYKTAVLFSTNKMVEKLAKILVFRGYDAGVLTGQTESEVKVYKDYISNGDYELYLSLFKEVFPRKKTIPQIKPKDGKYEITKPFKENIEKINTYINSTHLINETNIITILTIDVSPLSDRQIMKEKPIIISNFKMLSAGYDDSRLSCILFGSPLIGKVPVIQSLGRVTRINLEKIQEVMGQFFFTNNFTTHFPDMMHILVNNIKVQYPDAKFLWEGFEFGKKD